ncbi:MAG: efflux RND transporter permease subunit [Nitrospira sp.]
MSVSEHCIRRPVGTTLLTIGVTLIGLVAFQFLPVAALPQVEYPTIQCLVRTLPGGSPEVMADVGGGSARTPVGSHRRCHGDDLHQHTRLDQYYACSST